jgi:hypothetical protein
MTATLFRAVPNSEGCGNKLTGRGWSSLFRPGVVIDCARFRVCMADQRITIGRFLSDGQSQIPRKQSCIFS